MLEEGGTNITTKKAKARKISIMTNIDRADVFKAVQHPLRRDILKMICDSRPEGILFHEIHSRYRGIKDDRTGEQVYKKSNLSQHIKELTLAGLITEHKEGGFKRYFPNEEAIKVFSEFGESLLK